jgi:SAM-dependent methyltransferase
MAMPFSPRMYPDQHTSVLGTGPVDGPGAQPTEDRATVLKRRFYPESAHGGYADIDGTVVFHTRVNSLVNPQDVVVDIGCGRGQHRDDQVPLRRGLKILKGKCRHVIGIDVDPNARTNPFLDEFQLIDTATMAFPLSDSVADLCVTDYVLEHVREPAHFLSECRRVLKPGGHLCIRTTNVMSYVGLAALLTPNRLHARVVGWAQRGREARDVFPTQYRANTPWKLAREMQRAGFDHCVYPHNPEPSYLSRFTLAYRFGVFYQRHAPRSLAPVLFAFGRKR